MSKATKREEKNNINKVTKREEKKTMENEKIFNEWKDFVDRAEFMERIAQECTRNVRATATNHAKSYINGYILESWGNGHGKKKKIAGQTENDGFLNVPDAPKKSAGFLCSVEFKFGGADLSKTISYYLENGKPKTDFLVYCAVKFYRSDEYGYIIPIIAKTEDFIKFCFDKGLIRFDKSNGTNRNGKKPFSMQTNKIAMWDLLDSFTPFSPFHKYTYNEIINRDSFAFTAEEKEYNDYLLLLYAE